MVSMDENEGADNTDYSSYYTIEHFTKMNTGLYYENLGPIRLIGAEYKLITYLSLKEYQDRYVKLGERMATINDLCTPSKYETNCKNYQNVIFGMYKEIDQQRESLYISLGKNNNGNNADDGENKRRKRGLINAIGAGMHALFGLCDDECTKSAEEAIKRNEESTTNMLHILKSQTTVVKAIVKKFKTYDTDIQRSLNLTQEKELKLYDEVIKTRDDNANIKMQLIISELHNIYTVLVNLFAFETTTLQQIVTAARGGVIHSSLLAPSDLSNVLKEIGQRLRTRLSLPMGTRASELYELRKITKMSVYYLTDKIVFIIKIPLVTETELTLYNVMPIPIKQEGENSDKRLIIKVEAPYTAITKDRKQYTIFTENQVQNCKNTAKKIENSPDNPSKKTLKRCCETRWIERYHSVNDFLELYDFVVESLDDISTWEDSDTSGKAQCLRNSILNGEFIVFLIVLTKGFGFGLPLSKQLQKIYIDLRLAVKLAHETYQEIQAYRNDAENKFEKFFKEASKIADNFQVEIKIPRTSSRQALRVNINTTSAEEYYRVSVFIPYLESFANELKERFIDHETTLNSFHSLFSKEELDDDFMTLVNNYQDDLENGNPAILLAEYKLWQRCLKNLSEEPTNALQALSLCNNDIYPNIYKLLQILATLPVSTSSNERTFSNLKRIKTYLRNTIGEKRLNGLAMMCIHKDLKLTADEVLDELIKKKRKVDFVL